MFAHNFIDLTDQRFGKLAVIARNPEKKGRDVTWFCRCDCGNEVSVFGTALRRKNGTKSCGCNKHKPCKRWSGCGDISGSYWWHVKDKAARRNREFSITIEEAWDLFRKQDGKCAISGVPLKFVRQYQTSQQKGDQTASLDRIDSSKGYVLGNVQWVHKTINKLKNILSDTDLIYWSGLIAGRQLDYICESTESVRINEGNWTGHGEISGTYWLSLRHGAERRGIPFEITIEEAWDLYLQQKRLCAITGVPLIFSRNYMKDATKQTASLDRIDNNKGYTKDNVQWMHKTVNRLKWAFDQEDLIEWCKLIAEHQK